MLTFRGRSPVELAFGTSGLRGLSRDITDLEAYVNTYGFLAFTGAKNGAVAVAGDLRPSTDRILGAVSRAIEDFGLNVDYVGKIPTPALMLYGIKQARPTVMVTGSHIPFDRNGIKFGKLSGEVLKEEEAAILEVVKQTRAFEYGKQVQQSQFDDDGVLKRKVTLPPVNTEGASDYLKRYTNFFPPGVLTGMRVIVFQHSAVGRDLLVKVLKALGAIVSVSGRSEKFIPIDTEDISVDRLVELQRMVDESDGVDALVSTDGDSDRPLVAGVDSDSKVRFYAGDLLGIVVAKYLNADVVVVPVSTNDAVDNALSAQITKTKIGSPYVVKAMLEAEGENVVGWEANGGFLTGSIIERHGRKLDPLPTRDAVLPIISALAAAAEKKCSLSSIFSELPPRFSKAGLLDNVSPEVSLRILHRFTAGDHRTISLELETYFTRELGFGAVDKIDVTDGLRIRFANGDIAHVRPSGNAPQLRIYAVADSQSRAEAIVEHAVRLPDGILRRLTARSVGGSEV